MTIGHAIASAVNKMKEWAATGKPETKAKAAAALAQWEAKKGKSKAKSAIKDIKESSVETEAFDELPALVLRRLMLAEGMLPALTEPKTTGKASLVKKAVELLEADFSDNVGIAFVGGQSASSTTSSSGLSRGSFLEITLVTPSPPMLTP